jgi:hypothetical protein
MWPNPVHIILQTNCLSLQVYLDSSHAYAEKAVKFKFTPQQALKTQRRGRGIAIFFLLTSALDEGG